MTIKWVLWLLLGCVHGMRSLDGLRLRDYTNFEESSPQLQYLSTLQALLANMVRLAKVQRCFVALTDELHYDMYDESILEPPSFMLKLKASEDLQSPNNRIVNVLKEIYKFKCDLHLITILNGVQVKGLFEMIERERTLYTKTTIIVLHDHRLFTSDMKISWSALSSNYVLKRSGRESFLISTVPYEVLLKNTLFEKHLVNWTLGDRLRKSKILLEDPATNLNGLPLDIVTLPHPPMVIEADSGYEGAEIEIIKVLAEVLNFVPIFYAAPDMEIERWGNEQENGSFTGLLGEMTNHYARIAIGDLHFYQTFIDLMDLTIPHSFECLTFLTPESSQDNSWRTLIQPFSGIMWAGVLVSSITVGTIFYLISFLHSRLMQSSTGATQHSFFNLFRKRNQKGDLMRTLLSQRRLRLKLNRVKVKPKNEDLFDNFSNCIFLTYSMLVYVSLPQMPNNWPLRMLTGWYWVYCILLTVTYRASFTAILANPVARITIDSLEDLLKSSIKTSAWNNENKKFFQESSDALAQSIGEQMILLEGIERVPLLIAEHDYAYYDTTNFLRFLRESGKNQSNENDDEILHIMRDCVLNMPVALALEKNSPLREKFNIYIQRLVEAGLVDKWLKRAIEKLPLEERLPQEALMDLNKFWSSIVALFAGYLLAGCALLGEKLHFKYVVAKHPLYDKYNLALYYNFRRRYPNISLRV